MRSTSWSQQAAVRRRRAEAAAAPRPAPVERDGQRGWKRQPAGRPRRVGHLAGQRVGQEPRAVGVRDRGDQRLGVRVQRRAARARAVGPVSTIVPRYMTATASATWRTIARSCEISSRPMLELAGEPDEQVRDLRLRRGVERRERLVEHDHGRVGGERPRDRDALPLPAARTGAGSASAAPAGRPTSSSSSADAAASAARRRGSRSEAVGELGADLPPRVQRRVRVLEDHLQPHLSRAAARGA